jgi:serine protease inhibitor
VQSINNFAGDLYRYLAQDNEKNNLFFSPYSLSSALTEENGDISIGRLTQQGGP